MEYLNVIILGIVQGLTEFLPVSSSGHLILAPLLLGFADQGLALDAILHLGTLLAMIIYFRKDLSELAISLVEKKPDPMTKRLAWSILLASIPAGTIGLFAGSTIEEHLRNPTFVAMNLLVWSLVFYIADRFAKSKATEQRTIKSMELGQVMMIGFAQALALLPGTSRSGITIAAGLFTNLSSTSAARFSFLLGTPIILAAGIYELAKVFTAGDESILYSPGQLGVGLLVSFLVGLLAIKVLLAVVARVGLIPFIIYRVALAFFLLLTYSL